MTEKQLREIRDHLSNGYIPYNEAEPLIIAIEKELKERETNAS